MNTYKRLLGYLKDFKRVISLYVFTSLLFSVFSVLSVYLTIPLLKTLFLGSSSQQNATSSTGIAGLYEKLQYAFDRFIFSSGKETALITICLLIIAAYVLKNLTGFVQSYLMQTIENKMVVKLRMQLYERINQMSLRFFTQEKTGNLLSRMTNDITNIQSGISALFYDLLKEPLVIIIFLFLALSISWQMTVIAFIVFPITVFLISKIGSSLRRRSIRVQEKLSDLLNIISETIYGAKVIRIFSAEKYRNNIFRNELSKFYHLTMRSVRASELTSPLTETLSIISGVLVIWFGGREIIINNNLKPEEFLGFLFILFQIIPPVKNLSTVYNRLQKSFPSAERIFEIIDHPLEVKNEAGALKTDSFTKSIEFKNVSFGYEKDKPVLEGINLTIDKSQIVAIVGSSGAGKSTMADLISRFYDVSKGEIFLDDRDIRDIDLESLRKLICIVPQEIILFNDTIRNNIVFGKENVNEETLVEMCRYANAHEFIMNTEKGYDTVIGERGLKLSGGQKQRLSIARALLRNPQILILDEATSSLDNESEKLVQEALDKLMFNRTSIVIAHRLSTIINADRIYVLSGGKIVQEGAHKELISDDRGLYKKLYDMQFYDAQ
ncbi:MAG: ABC transporter ATP-binding protein/permease [Bacteroidetes bacterium]|nr:ABC transporter ATP-binding protein/permease [Bacteroidota bacterium]